MKKTLVILLSIFLVFITSACHEKPENAPDDDKNIPVDNQIDEEGTNVDSEGATNDDDKEVNEEPSNKPSTQVNTQNPCVNYGLPVPTKTHEYDDGNKLILVNKQYAVGPNFYPTDLVAVDRALSTNKGIYFKREAYDAYLRMLGDANAQGISFIICSTYRSYALQESLYFGYIKSYGVEYTNTISAYPGRSEHHTGWAVDITSASMNYGLNANFVNYPEGQWINEHCHEYGFIIRYPKDKTHITGYAYEPWHLRYVGVDVATQIMTQGLTLEEYLGVA